MGGGGGGAPQYDMKPHAVCIPFPAQGHINPMLKLALLLHHKGFTITFVHTDYNFRRLLRSRAAPESPDGLPDFRFETIPDGLPYTDADSNQDLSALCDSTKKNCLAPLRSLLEKINSAEKVPPVSCLISDAIMSFAVAAAKEIGVPSVCFRTTNALGLLCNKHLPFLIEKGLLPLKDESDLTNGYLETTLDDLFPKLKNMRLRDLPSFFRTTDVNDTLFNFVMGETEGSSKASAILINTFDALESDALIALSPMCPPLYTIGPIHLLASKLPQSSLNCFKGNLWKEEPECLQWLTSKELESVVYVNFGSITVLTHQQLVEFAWGLANCKKNFLWIIRSGSVVGDSDDFTALLPAEFLEQTRERGLIARWCPQEQVLNHPSIAVFLTHCGWNSMIESLASGVPMICWPFFADQQLNCRCACTKWGVGLEIDNSVKRDEVEKLVIEVFDGEEGRKMRNKALDWKLKIEAATSRDGSSYSNLDKLVNEMLLAKA